MKKSPGQMASLVSSVCNINPSQPLQKLKKEEFPSSVYELNANLLLDKTS